MSVTYAANVGSVPFSTNKKAKTLYNEVLKHVKQLLSTSEVNINTSYGALLRDLEKEKTSQIRISKKDRADLSIIVTFSQYEEL